MRVQASLSVSGACFFVQSLQWVWAVRPKQADENEASSIGKAVSQLGKDVLDDGASVHTGLHSSHDVLNIGSAVIQGLGRGMCVDSSGRRPSSLTGRAQWNYPQAVVVANGSAPECEMACLKQPSCTGFVVRRLGGCHIITDHGFHLSGVDGDQAFGCFWRHSFKFDTAVPQPSAPVPKIIWSFWQEDTMTTDINMGFFDRMWQYFNIGEKSNKPAVVELAMESWRSLNPDYDIRMLDLKSLKNWLHRDDLPASFESMRHQHQGDALRLALLWKYGGVWIDATGIMIRPLEKLMGKDRTTRVFFTNDRIHHKGDAKYDQLVNESYYIENSFLAAAPGDLLLGRARSCFMEVFKAVTPVTGEPRSLHDTGVFTEEQVKEAEHMSMNGYLSMMACYYKALDEDQGLLRFYQSREVHKLHAMRGLFPHLLIPDWPKKLIEETHEDLAKRMLGDDESLLIKLRQDDRSSFDGLTKEQLRNRPSTLRLLLPPAKQRSRAHVWYGIISVMCLGLAVAGCICDFSRLRGKPTPSDAVDH